MGRVSESEARELLSCPLLCEGDQAWRAHKRQPDTYICEDGLQDDHGRPTSLQVQLLVGYGRSHTRWYKFSVFSRGPYGLDLLYQLDIYQSKRTIKDAHLRPHEHIGDLRILGLQSWRTWDFAEVLSYFCTRSNVRFVHELAEPAPAPSRR